MESVKNVVKQYAILKSDYFVTLPDGQEKKFAQGEDLLLGGKYGYQYDLSNRGVLIPVSDGVNHLIPESYLSFEEEIEVISIKKIRSTTSPP